MFGLVNEECRCASIRKHLKIFRYVYYSFNDKYFDKLFPFLIKICDEKFNYEDTAGKIRLVTK